MVDSSTEKVIAQESKGEARASTSKAFCTHYSHLLVEAER